MYKVPLYGVLATVSRPARREAYIEVGLSILFATLPIWFGVVIGVGIRIWAPDAGIVSGYASEPIVLQALYAQINRGELFMYAAALTGPVIYEAFRHERHDLPPNPSAGTQMTLWVVVVVVAAGLFLAGRLLTFTHYPSYIWCSIALYVLGISFLVPMKAFSHSQAPSIQEQQRADENQFVEGYQEHRGDV